MHKNWRMKYRKFFRKTGCEEEQRNEVVVDRGNKVQIFCCFLSFPFCLCERENVSMESDNTVKRKTDHVGKRENNLVGMMSLCSLSGWDLTHKRRGGFR